jgi:hypothetical protein
MRTSVGRILLEALLLAQSHFHFSDAMCNLVYCDEMIELLTDLRHREHSANGRPLITGSVIKHQSMVPPYEARGSTMTTACCRNSIMTRIAGLYSLTCAAIRWGGINLDSHIRDLPS